MIFEFEFVKIKFICQHTNDLLSFDIEEDKRDYKMRQIHIDTIKELIGRLEVNRFDNTFGDDAYEEFNDKINECISALKNKIELTNCGKNSSVRIVFDENRYIDRVYKAY